MAEADPGVNIIWNEGTSLSAFPLILPEDTILNQKIIDKLDILLKLVSPQDMNKVLIYVFFMYIYYAENDVYSSDLKTTSEVFYLLIDYFTTAGEQNKK